MSTGWQQVKATWTFSAWEAVKVRNVFKTGRGGEKTLIHVGITWINRLLSTLPAFLLGPWCGWSMGLAGSSSETPPLAPRVCPQSWHAMLASTSQNLPRQFCLLEELLWFGTSWTCFYSHWELRLTEKVYAICVWFCFLWPSRRKLQLTWGFIWCNLFT